MLRSYFHSNNVLRPVTSIHRRLQRKSLYLGGLSFVQRYSADPRLNNLGPQIHDYYAALQPQYQATKNPIVLAHGLLGFEELRLAGPWLPGVRYWRGLEYALRRAGSHVITTEVPAAASIEERAQVLYESVKNRAKGQRVNLIAHSMGGLDSRYMISKIHPKEFEVASLTTIASPHRGSSLADTILNDHLGISSTARIRGLLDYLDIQSGAFPDLTQEYMESHFNKEVIDDPSVHYYSFGAAFEPHLTSIFRNSHGIIMSKEGPNDGMVSVSSSVWGAYQGTLTNVNHLDLINWTNQFRAWVRENIFGKKRTFNAVALYLGIADMLARKGF